MNLLRFLAALAVYLFHVQHFADTRIPFVGNLGSEAVAVFFVLSGLLITHSGLRQRDASLFVRARLARLWSVCLPALALTLAADTLGWAIEAASYHPMQPYSPFKWAASIGINALFLNQVWHLNIYPGTNGPFWSLSYEFWYYMIFAAAVYFTGWRRIAALAVATAIAGPAILVGMPIWLMGVAIYLAMKRFPDIRPVIGWILWCGSLAAAAAYGYFNVGGRLAAAFPDLAANAKWWVDFWPASYLVGAIVAAHIYGFTLIAPRSQHGLGQAAKWIGLGADISFGLYLFHYPLMYLTRAMLRAVDIDGGAWFVLALYAVPFTVSAVLALACERRKDALAGLIARPRKQAMVRATPLDAPLLGGEAASKESLF